MATYTPITNSEKDLESPITESLLTRYRQNPIAITEGASGAPKFQEAAYTAASVNRVALKTNTASSFFGGYAAQNHISIALVGGTYSWWTISKDHTIDIIDRYDGGSKAAGVIGILLNTAPHTPPILYSYYINERYFLSSPPYDMGDGEVPLFIYGLIDNATGEPISMSAAADPTWYNHGPTDLTPDNIVYTLGRRPKRFKTVRTIGDSGLTIPKCREKQPALFDDYMRGKVEAKPLQIEITPEYKNSDMHTHGHPWVYNPPEYFKGKTVVMLDPFCKEMQTLKKLHMDGADICQVMKENYTFDNEIKKRKGPRDVAIVGLKWKN